MVSPIKSSVNLFVKLLSPVRCKGVRGNSGSALPPSIDVPQVEVD